jgi:hypothetical protein
LYGAARVHGSLDDFLAECSGWRAGIARASLSGQSVDGTLFSALRWQAFWLGEDGFMYPVGTVQLSELEAFRELHSFVLRRNHDE